MIHPLEYNAITAKAINQEKQSLKDFIDIAYVDTRLERVAGIEPAP